MGSNRATAESQQNGSTLQAALPHALGPAPENELEIRIQNLDKLVHSVHAALDQASFAGKHHAIAVIADLQAKIKAIHNMFRLARLLREPARESMLSKVRDSVGGLEDDIAAQLHVELT